MNEWYIELLENLKAIQNQIEVDTYEYLESNFEKSIPTLTIEYNGKKAEIPIDLADINGQVQYYIADLIELVNECYVD